MLKTRQHIFSVIIPLLAALIYLFSAYPKIRNSSYSATSDLALRFLPALLIGLALIISFYLIRHFSNIKISALVIFSITALLSIFNLAAIPSDQLKDILDPLHSASDYGEIIVVPDQSLFSEVKVYNSAAHPIYDTLPDNSDRFWLLLPPTETSPYDDYAVINQISTPKYLALELTKEE